MCPIQDYTISKGSPKDNLSFMKQMEMDLSNESVEDCRNSTVSNIGFPGLPLYPIYLDIGSRVLPKFTWSLPLSLRYDTLQPESDELLHNTHTFVSTFQYETQTYYMTRCSLQCSLMKKCWSLLVWMGQWLPSRIRILVLPWQWRVCKCSHRV